MPSLEFFFFLFSGGSSVSSYDDSGDIHDSMGGEAVEDGDGGDVDEGGGTFWK